MKTQKRRIAVLGSTGSIGTQALDILRGNQADLEATVLVARSSTELLIKQALEFHPKAVVIADETHYRVVHEALHPLGIEVYAGADAIEEVVQREDVDLVLTAMVGYAGLRPTLSAIRAGKTIALANKETLVVAGEMIIQEAKARGVQIIPVDSEHSAIYQCLIGEEQRDEKKPLLEKILLTASGGPFRGFTPSQLESVTPQQALRHPNWVMGAKVTIDSASLMNKGLEMIEARWLFDTPPEDIEVVVHPQSIIHSMVQFCDGSVKAQLGQPDMRLPISYALGLTKRIPNSYPRLDFTRHSFTFERPDLEAFPNLSLAYRAIACGGTAPCVLNAANEVAVASFLEGKLGFRHMSQLIEHTLDTVVLSTTYDLSVLAATDQEARCRATEWLKKQ